MNKLIYTSYSPNTRLKDLLWNIVLILQPTKFFKGTKEIEIINFFKKHYKDSSKCYLFNYARSGMYILFKSLKLPENSEVIVQGFTCSAAVNPLLWAGVKIKYVDIDKTDGNMGLEELRNKLTVNTKAIMFQYTFGNSKKVREVKKLCIEKNIILIEDCTNTILGKAKDKLIGEYGDFAIFSFGRDKAISGINGGLIIINESKFISSFDELYSKLSYPPLSWIIKELLYPVFWQIIKSTFTIKIGKLFHLALTKLNLLTKASTKEEKNGVKPKYIPAKLPNALAHLALIQLEDIDKLNTHRLKINKIYEEGLSTIKQLQFLKYDTGNILLRFPVLVQHSDALVKFLKSKNVIVGDWYSSPITPTANNLGIFKYSIGTCPNSEIICKEIINLPNHINVSKDDAKYIISLIRNFYGY